MDEVLELLRVKLPKYLASIIFGLSAVLTDAQTVHFKNYSTKDGLITDEVFNLYQDNQGYIWVFSEYGTVKYTGAGFKPVLKNLPTKEAFIFSIFENGQGKKWVANSNARIYEVRNDSALIIPGIEKISTLLRQEVSEISQLYVDDSSNIYAITKADSYKFIKKRGLYEPVNLGDQVKTDSVHTLLHEIPGGKYMAVKNSGIENYTFKKGKKRVYLQIDGLPKQYRLPTPPYYFPMGRFKKVRNAVYFVRGDYLGKIIEGEEISYIKIGSLITNFIKDESDHIWLGTLNNGLYELNECDSVINHYLKDQTINDLFVDFYSGLWVSTTTSGIFHCESFKNKYFNKPEPLGEPLSFIRKIENVLFIATIKGDIFTITKGKYSQIRAADNSMPLAVCKHGDSYIITHNLKLEQFDPLTGIRTIDLKNGKRYDAFSKNKDTAVLIWRKGLIFHVKGIIQKKIDLNIKILSSELVGNTLWLGTENGVYLYKASFSTRGKSFNKHIVPESDTASKPDYLQPLNNSKVTKITSDQSGNLWFCTQGDGLFSLKGRQLLNYNESSGLPSQFVNDISFANNNMTVLSTNMGLFSCTTVNGNQNFTDWKHLFDGSVKSAVEFEGKIYLSTKNGLVVIDNEKNGNKEKRIFFNLSGVRINLTEVTPEYFSEVPGGQKSVEFKFDVISFLNNSRAVKYILQGPLEYSGQSGDGIVKFEQLVPGSYTLSAFPSLRNGETKTLSIPFTVLPALWQTFAFRFSLIFFTIVLVMTIVWQVISNKRAKMEERSKNERLLSEYKLIALKAQINPHFMSNCLSAIQDLIMNDNAEKATFYVAEFGLLVRQILDYSSKQLITLAEELDLLKIYMELEQLRFENKFEFKIHVDKDISLKETYLPPMILNPIVENAIWHGLLPVQNERRGEIQILVVQDANNLIFSIQDNGIGRERSKKAISNANGKSYGIKITEQRLNNINYLFDTTVSKIVYTDLDNIDKNMSGTRVTIYLPNNLAPSQNEQD